MRSKSKDAEYKRLVQDYRKLAKRADTRLERLEALSQQKGFGHVLEWGYKLAQRNIRYWRGADATRFGSVVPNDLAQLKALKRDVEQFLSMPTSTKSSILKMYKKRAETINKKYGTHFTWEDLAIYFERASAEKQDADYGSKTMLKAIGVIQSNERDIMRALKKNRDVDLRVENSKVSETVKQLISIYGKDVTKLYS